MSKEELTQSVKEHGRLTQFNEELDIDNSENN